MIYQTLRKEGDHYIITIPDEEIQRQHLQEGQLVMIDLRPAETALSDDLQKAFEASWQRNAEGYRYLAGH